VLSGRTTQASLRALDWLAALILQPDKSPPHQLTGRRGEIDLIGWEKNIFGLWRSTHRALVT
jgi:hypothetical protein